MTKFTVIEGGKFMGKPARHLVPEDTKVVTIGGTNFFMAPPTLEDRRQIVALFKQAIRSHVEAVADSGVLSRTVVLELAQQVIDDMDERI
jgi:hypothetical protein